MVLHIHIKLRVLHIHIKLRVLHVHGKLVIRYVHVKPALLLQCNTLKASEDAYLQNNRNQRNSNQNRQHRNKHPVRSPWKCRRKRRSQFAGAVPHLWDKFAKQRLHPLQERRHNMAWWLSSARSVEQTLHSPGRRPFCIIAPAHKRVGCNVANVGQLTKSVGRDWSLLPARRPLVIPLNHRPSLLRHGKRRIDATQYTGGRNAPSIPSRACAHPTGRIAD